MHQPFCRTCQAVGWCAGGEVPLCLGNGRGTSTADSGQYPVNPLLDQPRSGTEAPILAYPDPAKEYIFDTDASDHSVGAVLSQVKGRTDVVVVYYSKTLSTAEKNYCTTRKKLLAVVKAVKHFRPYLYGKTFRLQTDHVSLIWLCKHAEPLSQVARWLEILAEFFYRLEHGAGKKHENACSMSGRLEEDC